MATATQLNLHDQIAELEKQMATVDAEIAKHEATLLTLDRDKYRVSEKELPAVAHNRELTQMLLDRAKARKAEIEPELKRAGETKNKNDAAERELAPVREVEKIHAETDPAIDRLIAKLQSDPDVLVIARGFRELGRRRLWNGEFPKPPATSAAHRACDECVARLRPLFVLLQEMTRLG